MSVFLFAKVFRCLQLVQCNPNIYRPINFISLTLPFGNRYDTRNITHMKMYQDNFNNLNFISLTLPFGNRYDTCNIIYCVCDQYTKGNNIRQQKPFERKNKDRQSAHKPI